ncbi:MAG: hydroxyacid dehydrogenase [Anaerolineaceae bacterium]|nr:hydroxyacid dehydrogenase [Anaerolineaceae bacterium]
MKARLWIEFPVPQEFLAPLSGLVEIVNGDGPHKLAGSTVAIRSPGLVIDADFMDSVGPRLRLLAMPGTGLDHIDIPAASERGILVCNNPDAPCESTAEHTVGLLLAVAKGIVSGDRQLQAGAVDRASLVGSELRGRTLGVVGYGRIGRRVAEICSLGLKMKALVHGPRLHAGTPLAEGVTLAPSLDAVFEQADVVTLHTPLTAETWHLVQERHLRLMKRGSYLINTSRGAVVDEDALIRVLQEGHLAGAGLDVFDPDPPAGDNPLLHMPNVVATPHIAPFTEESFRAMWSGVALQIRQVLRGERPDNLANPEVWPGRQGQG